MGSPVNDLFVADLVEEDMRLHSVPDKLVQQVMEYYKMSLRPCRTSALRNIVQCAGTNCYPLILQTLSGEEHMVHVCAGDCIKDLSVVVSGTLGMPHKSQIWVHDNVVLDKTQTLAHAGIHIFNAIVIVVQRQIHAASASVDGSCYFFELTSGLQSFQIPDAHKGSINVLAVDWSAWLALTGSVDCTIKLWDLFAGEQKKILQGHRGSITDLQVCWNQELCVSASSDGTVKLWKYSLEQCLISFDALEGDVDVCLVEWSMERMLSACSSGWIFLWALDSEIAKRRWHCHLGGMTCIDISWKDDMFCTGSWDISVKLWDISEDEHQRAFTEHDDIVNVLKFDVDSDRLVTAAADKTIVICSLSTGVILQRLEQTGIVWSIAVDWARSILLSNSHTSLKLWNMTKGLLVNRLEDHMWNDRRSVLISVDWFTEIAITTTNQHAIKVWNLGTGEMLECFTHHTDYISTIAMINGDVDSW